MDFAGMFINDTEHAELDLLINHTTHPREPLFLSNGGRRSFEVHRFLPFNNDDPVFHRLTDMRADTRYIRILFRPVVSPFPLFALHNNKHSNLILHVLDDTFCSHPRVMFSVDQAWDYPTFLTELLRYLSTSHPIYDILCRNF
jgi:hypothetical protein